MHGMSGINTMEATFKGLLKDVIHSRISLSFQVEGK